jgi:hypothetical protein
MSHGASIYHHRYNPPIASEVLHGSLGEQTRLPDIMESASAREIEVQLVMDRLLREYLTRKVDARARAAP